MANVRIT